MTSLRNINFNLNGFLYFTCLFWFFGGVFFMFVLFFLKIIYLTKEEANEIVLSLMKGKEEALEFRCISV